MYHGKFCHSSDGITAKRNDRRHVFTLRQYGLDILGWCVSGPVPTTRLLSRIGPLRKLSICPNPYPTVIDRQMVFPTTPTYFGEQMRGVLS